MKIAHIVCTYPPYFGGMGNSVFQIAETLSARGHDVTVYTPLVSAEPDLETRATVARVAPSLSYGNGGLFPTITRELDQFDVVHLHYPFFGVAGKVRRWKLRHPHIPLVTTYHMDPRGAGLLGAYMRWYAQHYMPKVLTVSDAIIASTLDFAAASEARAVYADAPNKWHDIPFGVDTGRFTPERANTQLRYELGAAHTPLLLFVGGMDQAHHFKGISVLLRAMRQAVQTHPLQLVLVGDGELRSQYEAEAVWLGLRDCVTFVGRVPDNELPSYYATADCTILPSVSRAEAFGMVLLESMASGTPVIASDLPGVRSIAAIGGTTVPVGDVDALAGQLRAVSRQSETDRQILHQRIAERYTWEAVGEQIEAVYRRLFDNSGV